MPDTSVEPQNQPFKDAVLEIMNEWQAELATERSTNPTEVNGAELYQVNEIINRLQAI